MSKLEFLVSNNGTMQFIQNERDGDVIIHTFHNFNDFSETKNDIHISNGDMVMLINLYRYVKDHDIQNDFINPDGKNKEDKI